jgi:hypothetical protein
MKSNLKKTYKPSRLAPLVFCYSLPVVNCLLQTVNCKSRFAPASSHRSVAYVLGTLAYLLIDTLKNSHLLIFKYVASRHWHIVSLVYRHINHIGTLGNRHIKSARCLILVFALIGHFVSVSAQDSRPAGPYAPKLFYFPFNRWELKRDFRGNREMLDSLDSLLRNDTVVSGIDTIQIISGCSPVGDAAYNKRLAALRANSMVTYLRRMHRAVAESYPIEINPVGIDRDGYEALRRSGLKLTEQQMWDLLQYASVRLKMKAGRFIHDRPDIPLEKLPEDSLAARLLNTGDTFPPGLQPELPEIADSEAPAMETAGKAGNAAVPDTTIAVAPDIAVPALPVTVGDSIYIRRNHDNRNESIYTAQEIKQSPFPPFALKTNLLYDLALLPNLSVEVPFGVRWSAVLNGYWSWWDSGAPSYWSHRVQWAGIEIRYWKDGHGDSPLTGWFAGAYLSGGNYDLRLFPNSLDSYGYLSHWSWSAGLVGGYSLPLSAKLSLEFSLNMGYFTGEYHAYNRSRCTDCYPERRTGERNWWGPTGAGVSLVWKIME